uniref:CBS domain-containing protein n=1 Tax=Romanomermis culicivorax TaxID=13658 RepID=A0A915IAH1_ROMCU
MCIARLPLPACMHSSLDELRLGTWNNLLTVFPETKISECLEKMILGKISCLPVVRKIIVTSTTQLLAESHCTSSPPPPPESEKIVLLNVLTKHDILNLIVDEYGAAKCDVNDFLAKKASDVLVCKSQH